MSRQSRKLSSKRIYHIVIKGADRSLLFESDKDYQKYLDILEYYKQKCDFEIFAYCLMSNHVHLLIRHSENITLPDIFRRINTTYAGWFNKKYNRTGFLQNDRFHSEPIEDLNYLLTVLIYIHRNPYKAGLETSIGSEYPWSSYYEYINESPVLANIDLIMNDFDDIKQFTQAHLSYNEQSDYKCLDIDKLRSRLPESVAKDIIRDISCCESVVEFQNLPVFKRDEFIKKIHQRNVSIRQINRLTGISRGIISKIILNK